MEDKKYIVFKKDEFSTWYNDVLKDSVPGVPMALEDAVVLRTQDVLARGPLVAYAREAEEHELWEAATYFHNRAMEAEAKGKKLPD